MKKLTIALLVGVVAIGLVVGGASGKSAKATAGTQVCVLLPDTTSSPRWQQFDKPAFVNAFKKAGLTASIVNALNQPQKQLAQAEQCINDGAKVGVIVSLDTGTSIAIQKKFTAAGGKTIDYDRQIVGGTGSVYISFDGNQVGRIQARGVITGMVAKKTYGPKGVIAQLWGGPTDANAFWFKSGNDDVLNPLFKVDKVTKGPSNFVPDWVAVVIGPVGPDAGTRGRKTERLAVHGARARALPPDIAAESRRAHRRRGRPLRFMTTIQP